MNRCSMCAHYHCHKETESWEMPHIFWYERSCDARPTLANLKQFPFKRTSCPRYSERTAPKPQNPDSVLLGAGR